MSDDLSPHGGSVPPWRDNQPGIQWDISTAVSHGCTVATATAGQRDVVINIGVANTDIGQLGEMSVELIKRFSVPPRTARALRDMLREVIANIDADRRRKT